MRAIKQNDVIDVIYDSWYGLPLEEADKVVRDYVHKKMIPIEWINHYTTGLIFSDDYVNNTECIDDYIYCIKEMVRDWKKENE